MSAADDRTALATTAFRIIRGNPTAEEVAALAVLLTARLRLQNEAAAAEAEDRATVHKLPLRRRPVFAPPGAWAS